MGQPARPGRRAEPARPGEPAYWQAGLRDLTCSDDFLRRGSCSVAYPEFIPPTQIVHSFHFEEVCEQIADGNPLIATLTTGSDYPDLKYIEFYTGVTTLEFDTALARDREVASHVVLLIGAASIGGNKGFYGLDAQGNVFCPLFAPDESWSIASRLTEGTVHCVTESSTVPCFAESSTAPALKKQKREPVCAGFGKINAETEFRMNFIKFARHGEEGSYVENLKLLNEDESSTDVLQHNMNLMYDGEYFDTRSRIVGTKLRAGSWRCLGEEYAFLGDGLTIVEEYAFLGDGLTIVELGLMEVLRRSGVDEEEALKRIEGQKELEATKE